MSEHGGESEGIRVQLARMEGKLDLSNLRHDQLDQWKVTVDQRLHRHGNELMIVQSEIKSLADHEPRINTLETENHQRAGEKRGISNTIKTAWMLGGSGVTAVLLAVLRKLGLM